VLFSVPHAFISCGNHSAVVCVEWLVNVQTRLMFCGGLLFFLIGLPRGKGTRRRETKKPRPPKRRARAGGAKMVRSIPQAGTNVAIGNAPQVLVADRPSLIMR